jgi:Icc-related predicted phosphoesterase
MDFQKYYKEDLEAVPAYVDHAHSGNISHKSPVLKNQFLKGNDDLETIDDFIKKYDIEMQKNDTEELVSYVNKLLNDWNRDRNYEENEIYKVLESAIKENKINIKDYQIDK